MVLRHNYTDADKRPSGVKNFRMQQMVDASGRPIDRKWDVDAEGFAVKDGVATVGFERDQRVAQFKIDPDNMKAPVRQLDCLVPARELRQNRGFETVAHANPYGQHAGGLVVVSEGVSTYQAMSTPLSSKGRTKASSPSSATAISTLPTVPSCRTATCCLERSFSIARGVKMRLRRIYGGSVEKGALADGPVLMEAGMGYQIENLEGLDVWTRDDGAPMLSLISDDNHSILQRNLYLEFILHQD
ncbi:esterase-like activity of phytase family protein [Mesorhizobium sp.]|uniref:esterase-like activity of phytase family protein n=1 Tax=Mesorhizobium sp. TaxID=1871066 RepID=UPI003438A3D5